MTDEVIRFPSSSNDQTTDKQVWIDRQQNLLEEVSSFLMNVAHEVLELDTLFEAIGKFDDGQILMLSKLGKRLSLELHDRIDNFSISMP